MTTQCFLRNAVATTSEQFSTGNNDARLSGTASAWGNLPVRTTRGSGVLSFTSIPTVTGPTNGVEVDGGGPPLAWVTPPIDQDVTISGTITFNLWMGESGTAANAGAQCVIERIDSTGAIVSTISDSAKGVELPKVGSIAAQNWTATPTSTNMLKGDRIRIRPAAKDAGGTMASGNTFQLNTDGTVGASGDSYVQFNETFGFLTTDPTTTTVYPTDTASDIDPGGGGTDTFEAWTSRGSGVVTALRDTVAGWTAPLQLRKTDSTAGNLAEWFTKPLTAFTLSAPVLLNVRAVESTLNANASIRAEIAVCDNAGTLVAVWGGTTHPTELTTSEAAYQFYVAGDDVAVTAGQRLRIRVYFDDSSVAAVATSGGGVITAYYAGTSGGASGDTYLIFGQALTEYVAPATAPFSRPATISLPAPGRKTMGPPTLQFQKWMDYSSAATLVVAPLIGPTGTTYTPTKVTLTVQSPFIGPTGTLFTPSVPVPFVVPAAKQMSFPGPRRPSVGPPILVSQRWPDFSGPRLPGLIGPTGTLYTPTIRLTVASPVIGPTNTLYSPSVLLTVKPGLIGPTGTLYTPTRVYTSKVYGALIGPTSTLYAPTIRLTVKPGLIGPTSTLYAPSVKGIVKPSLIGPTSTLYAPSIRLTVKPGLIGPTSTVYTPTKVTLTVKPPLIGPTGTLYAPAVYTSRVYAPAIGPTGTLYAPAVSSAAISAPSPTISLPGVRRSSMGPPTLAFQKWLDYTAPATAVVAPFIGPTGTTYTPTKVTLTVKPGLIGPTSTLYAPSIRLTVKPGLIGPTGTTYTPTKTTLTVKPPAIGPTGTTYAPSVKGIVKPGLIGPTGTLYAPSVRLTVKPGLIGPTGTTYAPTKTVLTVKPSLIGPTSTVYAPSVASGAKLPPLIGPTGTLYAPTKTRLTVFPPLIGPTGVVYAAEITVPSAVAPSPGGRIDIHVYPPKPPSRRVAAPLIDARGYLFTPNVWVEPFEFVRRRREEEEILLLG